MSPEVVNGEHGRCLPNFPFHHRVRWLSSPNRVSCLMGARYKSQ